MIGTGEGVEGKLADSLKNTSSDRETVPMDIDVTLNVGVETNFSHINKDENDHSKTSLTLPDRKSVV